MTNALLNNESLKKFIQAVNINEERKDFLLSKLPQMDLEERMKLFNVLKEVCLLDLEEERAVERVRKFWEK